MTDKTAATASVLEQMTAGVMGRKTEKAAMLSPVGAERGPLPERTNASFPNDHPLEVVSAALRNMRREIASIVEALDAIEALNGGPVEVPLDSAATVAAVKADEKAADSKFAVDFTAKQAAAQAAVYRDAEAEPASPTVAVADGGWECPAHGANVKQVTSRKGRVYRLCLVCEEFEK